MKYTEVQAMRKAAFKLPVFRKIRNLSRPFYPYDGPNSWMHIQLVRRRAQNMTRTLLGRSLKPEEYAAILMHDNTKAEFGGLNHGRMGALRALKVLAAVLPKHQLEEAAQAIAVHDDNLADFPSHTAELLASADANPPDLGWTANKSYNYAIRHGLKGMDRYKHVVEQLPRKYGEHGTFNYPGIYQKYYGKAVQDYRRALDEMTPLTAKLLITAYRNANDIKGDELTVVHNK